jgi:hypothetical protein
MFVFAVLPCAAFAQEPPAAPAAPVEAEPQGPIYPMLYDFQCKPEDPNYDIEILYAEGNYADGVREVDARLATAPTAQLYWMKARFLYEIGERFERTDTSIDKEAHYQQMIDVTEKGLALAPGDLHLRFAHGVAMGRLGTTRGVLSSLFMAKDVEADWLSVATSSTFRYASLERHEVLPCDAYHALGIYYRLVPDWWIVQVIAGTRGDLVKSESFHQKAVACKPGEPGNWLELGVTQLCLGDDTNDAAMTAAGMASLRKAQGLTAHSARAKIDVRNAGKVLADPSLACEYSRDGQQDLDESKLEKQ